MSIVNGIEIEESEYCDFLCAAENQGLDKVLRKAAKKFSNDCIAKIVFDQIGPSRVEGVRLEEARQTGLSSFVIFNDSLLSAIRSKDSVSLLKLFSSKILVGLVKRTHLPSLGSAININLEPMQCYNIIGSHKSFRDIALSYPPLQEFHECVARALELPVERGAL